MAIEDRLYRCAFVLGSVNYRAESAASQIAYMLATPDLNVWRKQLQALAAELEAAKATAEQLADESGYMVEAA